MDPHKNIFYSYASPSKQNENSEVRYERQIENNITKSLINLLEKTDSHQIQSEFFSLLNGLKTSPQMNCRYKLQSIPDIVKNAHKKFVLIITNNPEGMSREEKGPKGFRPDAWIYCPDKSFAIMIESKINTPVYERQLRGHLKSCGWKKDDTQFIVLKWSEIYKKFSSIIDIDDKKDKFLLKEYLKYMEITGMSDFNGFVSDDFDFFINCDENNNYDDVYMRILKTKIKAYAELVFRKLPKIKRIYSELNPGNYREGSSIYVDLINPESKLKIARKFQFGITENEIFIGAVILKGKYDQKNTPIGGLYKKISNENQNKVFMKCLTQLKDYWLIISKRTDSNGKEMPRQNSEIWPKCSIIRLGSLDNKKIVDFITSSLENIKFPGMTICKKIERREYLQKKYTREKLIEIGVEAINKLYPIMQYFENKD